VKNFEYREHAFFGKYLELNPLGPEKVCSFDCGYCNLGPSKTKLSDLKKYDGFPPTTDLVTEFGKILGGSIANSSTSFKTLVISGNGEPTLFPDFSELVLGLTKTRQELMANDLRIVCLTNGDSLSENGTVNALNKLDQTFLKLDFGGERSFKQFNRPRTRTTLEKIIHGAKSLQNLSVQTTVLGGEASLESTARLDEWLEVIAMLKPNEVVLTLGTPPFRDPSQPVSGISGADEEALNRLSHWLDRRLKIKARVGCVNAA
jgi:wyosine [tRNA(Phe)-imidazoG37] synthetase (radical SAM superfamily)